jgi:hypothetical protein
MAEQDASFAESVRNRPLERHSAPPHLLRGLPDSPDIPRPVIAADMGRAPQAWPGGLYFHCDGRGARASGAEHRWRAVGPDPACACPADG